MLRREKYLVKRILRLCVHFAVVLGLALMGMGKFVHPFLRNEASYGAFDNYVDQILSNFDPSLECTEIHTVFP